MVADVSMAKVIGGAERVLYEQSTRLSNRGHRLHVLTRRNRDHVSESDVIEGVREWRYDVDEKNAVFYLLKTLKNCRRLFESLWKKFKPDVLIFHQPLSAYAVYRSIAARNPKKITICHSLWFEEYISRGVKTKRSLFGIFHRLNVEIRKVIERRVLRSSDRIVVLSRFTQEKLKQTYGIDPKEVKIIPGGVDLDRFQAGPDTGEVRRRLNIPPAQLVLITVRNLVPRMGLENLLNSMTQVLQQIPEAYLIIGGDGPLKGRLIELAQRMGLEAHIRFSGFIPEALLPEFYRAADLFVLPTKELEGFGLVTLEAMACGLPVIGTPVGGTSEILRRFDPSFLTSGNGRDAIARGIIEKCQLMKKDPVMWAEISGKCRRFVENNYSWDRHIDELETVLSGL